MRRSRPVPGDAPAVERGVGLFETVLVHKGRPLLWQQHADRLLSSLRQLELPAPTPADLDAAAQRALRPPQREDQALRLSWIAIAADLDDPRSWRLDAALRPVPEATLRRRAGVHAVSLPGDFARDMPLHKGTSYLGATLGLRYALRRGGNEGLLRAPDGSYREGTTTALLAWSGGHLLASPSPALPSVTAAAFLGGAEPARAALTPALLREGAVLLGSLTLAAPLLSLDGEPCAVPADMAQRIRRFCEDIYSG